MNLSLDKSTIVLAALTVFLGVVLGAMHLYGAYTMDAKSAHADTIPLDDPCLGYYP